MNIARSTIFGIILQGSIILILLLGMQSCHEKGKSNELTADIKNTLWQDIPFVTSPETDQPNNIRNYLMNEAEKITNSSLSNINTLTDWESVKDQRYAKFIQSLGLIDVPLNGEKPPLNVQITGTIKKEGYRIEKLYYEALPSLYVPANLYIPNDIEEPRPAILYLCGHASGQKVSYQSLGHKFAELGFVCLILETTHQGEVSGEHHGPYSRGWFNWYSRGFTPAGVEVWNAIRGLDLLSSREEVDADNLGVTGASGGGAQAWFVTAVDKRVKAAAPYVGATTLNEQILTRTVDDHCDCMMPINYFNWDFQDIGALIAPRPLLIGQGNRDRLTTIEGVREMHSGIEKIYEFYNKSNNVNLFEYEGGHGRTLIADQRMFSFFLEELKNKKVDIKEVGDMPEEKLSADELRVYVNGAPEDDKTKTIQDAFIKLPKTPEIKKESELISFKDTVLAFLKNYTFDAFPATPAPMDAHMVFRSMDKDRFGSNVFSFVTEEGWRLRIDIRWKYSPNETKPLLIVLNNKGERKKESENFTESLKLDQEWNVAYFNVRGTGNAGWDEGLQWHIRRASAWTGRTIASMQVYDVLRCLEFCRSLDGVDPENISIAARDDMGVVALYAALLDDNINTLVLNTPPSSQDQPSQSDGKGIATEMLNCLRIIDIWQIPALIPDTKFIFSKEYPDTYRWSEKVRKRIGKNEFSIL